MPGVCKEPPGTVHETTDGDPFRMTTQQSLPPPTTKRTPRKRKADAPAARVLCLRTCDANLRSYNRFQWPDSGPVEAPDWNKRAECGNGLHGLLWGEGDGTLLNWADNAKWLVVSVDPATIVELSGKVKFPRCEVVYCGDRLGSTEYLAANGAAGRAITGYTATAGYRGTATAGDSGTATAGYRGTATAGDRGILLLRRWDEQANRYRIETGYVGENGIKPNTPYRLNDNGEFVGVKP